MTTDLLLSYLGNHLLGDESFQRLDQRTKNQFPIFATEIAVPCPIRMWHHPNHISSFVTDTRDISQRPIGVRLCALISQPVNISKDHPTFRLEILNCPGIGKVRTFPMGNRHAENRSRLDLHRERCVVCLDPQEYRLTDKPQRIVSDQSPRQKP